MISLVDSDADHAAGIHATDRAVEILVTDMAVAIHAAEKAVDVLAAVEAVAVLAADDAMEIHATGNAVVHLEVYRVQVWTILSVLEAESMTIFVEAKLVADA